MACLAQQKQRPHFVLIPLLAPGHIIPMLDLAHLLAERGGVHVSLITSPANTARIEPTITRSAESDLSIEFVELQIPCDSIGLPDGLENVDLISDNDKFLPFFESMHLLRKPIELYLRAHRFPPSCMIADGCNPWTVEIAQRLQIPRLVFHGPSCFFVLCDYNTVEHKVFDHLTGFFEPFIVPDLPITVRVSKATGPGLFNAPGWETIREEVIEAERTADGIILNTFQDLERHFIEQYKKGIQKKVWTVGPLSLYNEDFNSKCFRGNKAGVDNCQSVLSWLDLRDPKSVIYVNFGSLARKMPAQLIELGFGLETTNRPFVWVLKESEIVPEVERWLKEFEERIKERGIIIRGWAPQLAILSHRSIGGFMTHCGWNSVLESISVGVLMVTWPHFMDQFINEKLVVDVLGVGVSVGVEMPTMILGDDAVSVKSDDMAKAVAMLMDDGEEAEERRRKVSELGEKARKAMENGGSSYDDVTDLVRSFMYRSD